MSDRPPGPRGAEAARTLARIMTGRPLEACVVLFARYGDAVYLPVRPWPALYILSRPEQAEHVLATRQDNYVKPFTYRPLRVLLGDGLLTARRARPDAPDPPPLTAAAERVPAPFGKKVWRPAAA